jgi:DNA helicase-2/ATP-dependent DNA helicase PcrA
MGKYPMTAVELHTLLSKPNGAIIAPAGHGKTEMITDIVEASSGRQLLLTHTNAGVDALSKRLEKKKIPRTKYTISTIAAFCIRWCLAYKNTAGIPNFQGIEQVDFNILYDATSQIFINKWAGKVLQTSYSNIIIDEYQDCTLDQHSLVLILNFFLPVYILGDPLQGIFDWENKSIVDWDKLEFEIIEVTTEPWRWKTTNPRLGEYLKTRRKELLPSLKRENVTIQIEPVDDFVRVITPDCFNGNNYKINKDYKSILYITKWPGGQLQVCRMHPWQFQYDENQELQDLFTYAKKIDSEAGFVRALGAIQFLATCATQVKKELKSYIDRLKKNSCDFSRIKKYEGIKEPLQLLCQKFDFQAIRDILCWTKCYSRSCIYRRELYREMLRSINFAEKHNSTIYEGAQFIRLHPGLRKNYDEFRWLSSRTVLSKGLEFDCVLIDMTNPPRARDFYVAITRAKYEIIFITSTKEITLSC